MKFFKDFKKELACNITLIAVLVFSAIHFLLITLNLFGVINLNIREGFNYILGYIMIIICLALYILGFFISRFKRIVFPQWLRICFYVAFYLFTNVYYILGLHDNVFGIIFLYAYLAFLANIVSVSVFYNIQKDEKYRLKTSKAFITTSIFFYSLGALFVVELLTAVMTAFIPLGLATATLSSVVIELSSMLLVTIIMSIIFDVSLSKKKWFINICLVKTYPKIENPKQVNEKNEK